MKIVVQKVKKAKVTVDSNIVGSIEKGMVVLLGFAHNDTIKQMEWIANKIANLRIFEDEAGVMNKSLSDFENMGILFISNFTLYGNIKKGFRPSYVEAAPNNIAQIMYQKFLDYFKKNYSNKIKIQEGIFGAMMEIELINDGPVTIIIEKE